MGLWFSGERKSANLGLSCSDEKLLKSLIYFLLVPEFSFLFIFRGSEIEIISNGMNKKSRRRV